jgi:hypothetical protein
MVAPSTNSHASLPLEITRINTNHLWIPQFSQGHA